MELRHTLFVMLFTADVHMTILAGKSFGLVSIICNEASFSSVHTSTGLVLRNIQRWLHNAAVSSLPEVRDLALQALQRLSVASGSLCGLLQLATCLMLNTRERVGSTIATADMNRKRWNQLDLLSEDGQSSAQLFVQELAASIQRIVLGAHSRVDLQDKHVIEQLFLLQEEGMHAAESKSSNELGLIILHMISELSAWQMKRMQKAEEYTGKHKLELMQLEEPFSMEICPELFAISHRLLISVLSGPHQQRQNKTDSCTQNGDEEDDDAAVSGNDGGNDSVGESFQDLYDDLALSFGHFRADVEKQEEQSDSLLGHSHGGYTDNSKFSPEGLCVAVLEIVTSNLRRLVLSKIDPIEIGITPAQAHNENDLLSAPPALNPTVSLLEQLISLGTKRSDAFFPVSLKAAAAMEVGTEAFHPSVHQRTKVLASRMGKGATLEVQVRWPVQERDQEDPRYERLILMLQLECIKLGVRQAVRGTWYFFMHLVVEVPSTHATEEVLTQHFAPCIQRAGFSSWQVTAGAQELSIKLQRHLHWNRVEKMLQDSGAGWIRVYPADVASYDEVLADVEGFLAEHGTYG
ncbi:hypothetical protein KXD40_001326 [Peronospora effusa]|nr:hypothetical protein KXD40_001326 [Peronospora effusa]